MEKRQEACPWCQKPVLVDPTRRLTWRCTSCNRNFTFTPGEAHPAGSPAMRPIDKADVAVEPGTQAVTAPASPQPDFVETPFIRGMVARSLAYLRDGLPVHLSGPAGGGKTTLALHLARLLGRPVVLIHGDVQVVTSDLVGKESGRQRTYVRDQFIHSVLKVQEEDRPLWVDKVLAEACREGYTLVYDEFTRSRPEANNVLLSVLQERVLPLRSEQMSVHPDFRVIFTSNPAEYAGVHGAQDALLDRMVTIHLDELDRDTEAAISRAHSGLPLLEVERIVDLVRAFRDSGLKTKMSSIRPCIMIARILKVRGGHVYAGDTIFLQTCRDVLLSEARRAGLELSKQQQSEESLMALLQQHCSGPLPPGAAPVEASN